MKNIGSIFNKLRKSDRGKALLFFGFYLIFFIVLGVMFRAGGDSSIENYQEKKEDTISVLSLNGTNYAYDYTIKIDGTFASYNGVKNGNKELLTYSTPTDKIQYFRLNQLYYVQSGNDYVDSTNPSVYDILFDNIDSLIKDATYVAKTSYKSGKEVLIYEISSATINKLIFGSDLDVSEIPNEILVTIEDNYITNVNLKLDSYCSAINACINGMSITMKYSGFGQQEEIVNYIVR